MLWFFKHLLSTKLCGILKPYIKSIWFILKDCAYILQTQIVTLTLHFCDSFLITTKNKLQYNIHSIYDLSAGGPVHVATYWGHWKSTKLKRHFYVLFLLSWESDVIEHTVLWPKSPNLVKSCMEMGNILSELTLKTMTM